MRCPYCRHADSRVVDSREADDGQLIRRRRSCPECGKRFTTVEEAILAVVKRSGVTEPFSRVKVMTGARKACQGRPVDEDAIALLAQRVEEAVRARGVAEIPSHEVGLAILGPLRDLDEVAYLRFASVYRSFDSLGDFERRDRGAARGPDRRCRDRDAARSRAGRATAENDAGRRRRSREQTTGSPQRNGMRAAVAAGSKGTAMSEAVGDVVECARHAATAGQRRQAAGRAARRAGVDHRGRAPVRRGDLGAPRRRHDQLARRLDQLRAARRRVPRLLERQRRQHRHHEVLPRRGRHARARVEPQAAHRPGRAHLPQGRRGVRLLRHARRRRDLRPRADLDAAAPGVQLQLAGLVQRRHARRRSRSAPASSSPSTTRWTRSSTGTRRRA